WRYSPESSSADTTVSGACAVALLAARNAGFEIPKSSVKDILDYYKSCQSNDGGIGYTSANGSNGVRSSIGTLVYQLSRKKKRPEYKLLLNYILNSSQNTPRSHRYYYLYYTSQAQFHAGHKYWEVWNKQNIQLLLNSQNSDGSWSGSSGLAFCTSTALLSLALNYRFLPIYER
ncbi:MAG: squalene--hopene cyclase, partial [Lentisphaeria bacterium]|nr:squalene--hopene cyclase [Lentisphaeria bacterium]